MTAYIVRDGDAKLTDIEMKNYLKGKNLLSLILCEDSSSPFYLETMPFLFFPFFSVIQDFVSCRGLALISGHLIF